MDSMAKEFFFVFLFLMFVVFVPLSAVPKLKLISPFLPPIILSLRLHLNDG